MRTTRGQPHGIGPHRYAEDGTARGTCQWCHLADPDSHNRIHQPDKNIDDKQAEHRRRTGEKDGR